MLKIFHGALSSSLGAIVGKLCPKQILALPTSLTLALPVELRKHAGTHHNITAKAGFKGAKGTKALAPKVMVRVQQITK